MQFQVHFNALHRRFIHGIMTTEPPMKIRTCTFFLEKFEEHNQYPLPKQCLFIAPRPHTPPPPPITFLTRNPFYSNPRMLKTKSRKAEKFRSCKTQHFGNADTRTFLQVWEMCPNTRYATNRMLQRLRAG